MRLSDKHRRLLRWAAAIAAALVLLVAVGGWLAYPRVGAWAIRDRVLPKLEARLDRQVEVDDVEVARGQVILRGVRVAGPADDGEPLARIERIVVDYDFWPSLHGEMRIFRVTVEGLAAHAWRDPDGDNFRDILDRLRGAGDEAGDEAGGATGGGLRPELIVLRDAYVELRDAVAGVTLVAGDVGAVAERGGRLQVTARDLTARSVFGPEMKLESLIVTGSALDPLGTAEATVYGGSASLWSGMSLTGIRGTLASGDRPGRLRLDLSGGYGGVEGRLWRGEGWIDPRTNSGELDLAAERFTFDRISPILADSMVIDYHDTSVDADVRVEVDRAQARIGGRFALSRLNLFHRMISDQPLRNLDVSGTMAAVYDRGERRFTLGESELTSRGVTFRMDGSFWLPGGVEPETGERRERARLHGHLVIPPLPCQKMLDAIPPELATYLQGMKVRGTFSTDVRVAIDWADLQATELGGSVALRKCKVLEPPKKADAKRLLEEFVHHVEDGEGDFRPVVIGPSNRDYVPLWDVSPYLVRSLMTTEDSGFYRHKGFIVSEFRTALIKNLEAGYFKYGASSITMQTVKNIFLYREKTLSRKLQELVLTWYIEQELDKDRILEIYVNAIEYGPGIYGIGPAAAHYFGKYARDLDPREAAYFSSTLPDPKRRYKQYCNDKLIPWIGRKIERILDLMHKRERLDEIEYSRAKETPLRFFRPHLQTPRDIKACIERADKYLEHTQPTNPLVEQEEE